MNSIRLYSCGCRLGSDSSQAASLDVCGAIDMHCHVFVPAANERVFGMAEMQREQQAFLRAMGHASVEHNRQVMMPTAFEQLTCVDTRLADMNANGIAIQCLSPSPSQYFYWADASLSAELVLMQNNAIAELCQRWPERFVGLGTVSLQHPQLAVEQLVELMLQPGMKGVEISTRVNDMDLDDAALLPFWQAAEQLGALVFIHPFSSRVDDRLQDWYLSNLVGQPLESTIALSRLIFAGLFDRFPNIRILSAHGGGYLPQYCGRHNRGAEVRPEAAGLSQPPADYLNNIWFDSLVFSPHSLRHLIDQVGIGQVVLGTDYPFDMGSEMAQPWLNVLTPEERQAVLRDNAIRLLDLTVPQVTNDDECSSSLPAAAATGSGKEFL
ncbi:amidohydrolase family protein [Candidatus Thalassolituus haligoni]|uniref:amidohydrolase family protein n=1 Tax=Candidatus Thalassolituus haligoni TaxID=3100113 RepID=UPI003515185D